MQLAPNSRQRIKAAGPGRLSARLSMRTPLSVSTGLDVDLTKDEDWVIAKMIRAIMRE